MPLQVQLFDELKVALEEYRPEELNLMVPPEVEKPSKEGY